MVANFFTLGATAFTGAGLYSLVVGNREIRKDFHNGAVRGMMLRRFGVNMWGVGLIGLGIWRFFR